MGDKDDRYKAGYDRGREGDMLRDISQGIGKGSVRIPTYMIRATNRALGTARNTGDEGTIVAVVAALLPELPQAFGKNQPPTMRPPTTMIPAIRQAVPLLSLHPLEHRAIRQAVRVQVLTLHSLEDRNHPAGSCVPSSLCL